VVGVLMAVVLFLERTLLRSTDPRPMLPDGWPSPWYMRDFAAVASFKCLTPSEWQSPLPSASLTMARLQRLKRNSSKSSKTTLIYDPGKLSSESIFHLSIEMGFRFRLLITPILILSYHSRDLDLRKPIYQGTSAYGHFGRDGFTWETPKKLDF